MPGETIDLLVQECFIRIFIIFNLAGVLPGSMSQRATSLGYLRIE